MISQILMALNSVDIVDLPSSVLGDDDETDATASTSLVVYAAGNWQTIGNVTAQSGTWLNVGSASDYEIRATVVSGAVSSGTTGSWLALSSNRTWTRTCTIGQLEQQVVLTVEIRLVSTGYVYATSTVTLHATAQPGG